jgi:hypothetical protein
MGYKSQLNKECREILNDRPDLKEQSEAIVNETHLVRTIDLMLSVRAWQAKRISDDPRSHWGLDKLKELFEKRIQHFGANTPLGKSLANVLRKWVAPDESKGEKAPPPDEAARLFCQQSALEDWMVIVDKTFQQQPQLTYGLEFLAVHRTWRERHLAPCDIYVDECFERLCIVLSKHKDHAKEVKAIRDANKIRRVFVPFMYGPARFERLLNLAAKYKQEASDEVFPEGTKPLSDDDFWNSRIPSTIIGRDLAKWTFDIVIKGNRVKMPGMSSSTTTTSDPSEFANLAPEDPTVAALLPAVVLHFDKREFVSPLKNFHNPRPRFQLFEDEEDYKETMHWFQTTLAAAERGDEGQVQFASALADPIVHFRRILDTPTLAPLLFRLIGYASQMFLKVNGDLRTKLRGYTVFWDGCFIGPEDRLADGAILPRAIRIKLVDAVCFFLSFVFLYLTLFNAVV